MTALPGRLHLPEVAPTEPPRAPGTSAIAGIVRRNIRALLRVRAEFERNKTREERLADVITAFIGSIQFVGLQAIFIAAWVIVNTGLVPFLPAFDPFPFVMLAVVASVEAIFLSTFVLIRQNRMQTLADRRTDLDVQISLLAEHEITKVIRMLDCISERLGVHEECAASDDLDELERDVAPEAVLDEIRRAEQERRRPPKR